MHRQSGHPHTDKRQEQQHVCFNRGRNKRMEERLPAVTSARMRRHRRQTDEQRLSRKLNSKLQRTMLFKHTDDTTDQAGHTQDARPVDKTK